MPRDAGSTRGHRLLPSSVGTLPRLPWPGSFPEQRVNVHPSGPARVFSWHVHLGSLHVSGSNPSRAPSAAQEVLVPLLPEANFLAT